MAALATGGKTINDKDVSKETVQDIASVRSHPAVGRHDGTGRPCRAKPPRERVARPPEIVITIGNSDADIIGRDKQGWSLFVDGATNGMIIRGNRFEDAGSGQQKIVIRIGRKTGEEVGKDSVIKVKTDASDERGRQSAGKTGRTTRPCGRSGENADGGA